MPRGRSIILDPGGGSLAVGWSALGRKAASSACTQSPRAVLHHDFVPIHGVVLQWSYHRSIAALHAISSGIHSVLPRYSGGCSEDWVPCSSDDRGVLVPVPAHLCSLLACWVLGAVTPPLRSPPSTAISCAPIAPRAPSCTTSVLPLSLPSPHGLLLAFLRVRGVESGGGRDEHVCYCMCRRGKHPCDPPVPTCA